MLKQVQHDILLTLALQNTKVLQNQQSSKQFFIILKVNI